MGARLAAREALRSALDLQDSLAIARHAQALVALEATVGTGAVKLQLASADGQTTTVLVAENASEFDAFFSVPLGLRAGTYNVSLAAAHDAQFVPIQWYQSKANPRASSWHIAAPGAGAADAPTRVTIDPTNLGLDYILGIPRNATSAIDRALLKCKLLQAPCEVYFPRGMYWYQGGMRIPKETSLVGEATNLVSLLFYEQDNGTTLAGGAPGCKSHLYG